MVIFFQAPDYQPVVCFAFAFVEICAWLKEDRTTGCDQLQQTCSFFNQSETTKTKCDFTYTGFPALWRWLHLYARLAAVVRGSTFFPRLVLRQVLIGSLRWLLWLDTLRRGLCDNSVHHHLMYWWVVMFRRNHSFKGMFRNEVLCKFVLRWWNVNSSFPSLSPFLSILETRWCHYIRDQCFVYIISSLRMWTTRLLQFKRSSLFTEPTLYSGRWDWGTYLELKNLVEKKRERNSARCTVIYIICIYIVMSISLEIFRVLLPVIFPTVDC